MKLVLRTTNNNPPPPTVKRNASIKYMIKALLINNYDVIEDSFIRAKDKDRLNFITKALPFICSKQTDQENGGEWILPENMSCTWFTPEEIGSVERRRIRNERNYNLAMNDLIYTHEVEWRNVTGMMEEGRKSHMEPKDLRRIFEGELEAVRKDNREDKRRLQAIFDELREFYDQQLDLVKQQYQDKVAFPQSNVDTEVINLAFPSSLPTPEQRKQAKSNKQTQQQTPSPQSPSPHLNPSTLDAPQLAPQPVTETTPPCTAAHHRNLPALPPALADESVFWSTNLPNSYLSPSP